MREALIIGGTGAIGLAVARKLSANGFRINLVARNLQRLRTSAKEIGKRAYPIAADVMEESGLEKIQRICAELKPELIAHAYGSRMEFSESNPLGGWRECMEMYFFRPLAIDQAAIPHFIERKRGILLHITSYATVDSEGFGPYAAAKGALNQYIKTEGPSLKRHGITLAALMPRAVEGGRNRWAVAKENDPERYENVQRALPGARFQRPEEVADAIEPLLDTSDARQGGQILSI